MVSKSYLKYARGCDAGVVVSCASLSVQPLISTQEHQNDALIDLCFIPQLENVAVRNIKSGQLVQSLRPYEAVPTATCSSTPLEVMVVSKPVQLFSDANQTLVNVAVGYSNGHIALFRCSMSNIRGEGTSSGCHQSWSCDFYALGHKPNTHVLCLCLAADGGVMVSGGQDTTLAVWDCICQEPLYRLAGHRGAIIGCAVVTRRGSFFLSAAADGLIKVWNAEVQQCIQTVVVSDTQVTAMLLDPSQTRLFAGLRENVIKVFQICYGTKEDDSAVAMNVQLVEHGVLQRRTTKAISNMFFSGDGVFLLAQCSNTIEVYQSLSSSSIKLKVQRRRKRRRDQQLREGLNSGAVLLTTTTEPLLADEDVSKIKFEQRSAGEEFSFLRAFSFPERLRSSCLLLQPNGRRLEEDENQQGLRLCATFTNNEIATYTSHLVAVGEGVATGAHQMTLTDLHLVHSLTSTGHATEIKLLAFTEDDAALISLSGDGVKLWSLSLGNKSNSPYWGEDSSVNEEKERVLNDAWNRNVAVCTTPQLACTSSVSFSQEVVTVGEGGGVVKLGSATCMAVLSPEVVCIGFDSGCLSLIQLHAADIVHIERNAHVGGVTGCTLLPRSNGGFVSVGVDRRVIFWTLVLSVSDPTRKSENKEKSSLKSDTSKQQGRVQHLSIKDTAELELSQSPLFVVFSPDQRLFGIGLQDNNVQLFFADTKKPFLSLYGHKLPPQDISFSDDGQLIATVGLDKSLRIWGADYGDCHRSIHAHDDYVTAVRFVASTHLIFTCAKDGSVKHWDGDTWSMLQVFRIHQRGLWSVCVNSNGSVVASAGVDRCIRLMHRTEDILFPEEEEDRLATEAMDDEAARKAAQQSLREKDVEGGVVVVAGQKTAASNQTAEMLMDALDLVSVELQRVSDKVGTKKDASSGTTTSSLNGPNPILKNRTVWEYLWNVLEAVKPSEMRHCVGALTSIHSAALLEYLEQMLSQHAVLNVELATKVFLALVAPAPGFSSPPVVAFAEGSNKLKVLKTIQGALDGGLKRSRECMTFNVAGLSMLMQHATSKRKVKFFDVSAAQGYRKKYHSSAI